MSKDLIKEAKQALAEKFDIPFEEIVAIPYKGGTAIIDGRVSCEHRGSYNDIMDAPLKDYEVIIDSKKYDTRIAMDWDLYKTFAEQAKEKPDRNTWTILTGEPQTELMKDYWGGPQVGFGGWVEESVGSRLRFADYFGEDARPRLAVILSDLSSNQADSGIGG